MASTANRLEDSAAGLAARRLVRAATVGLVVGVALMAAPVAALAAPTQIATLETYRATSKLSATACLDKARNALAANGWSETKTSSIPDGSLAFARQKGFTAGITCGRSSAVTFLVVSVAGPVFATAVKLEQALGRSILEGTATPPIDAASGPLTAIFTGAALFSASQLSAASCLAKAKGGLETRGWKKIHSSSASGLSVTIGVMGPNAASLACGTTGGVTFSTITVAGPNFSTVKKQAVSLEGAFG